jgi:hypothetical protein
VKPDGTSDTGRRADLWLLWAGAAALVVGAWARFKGLGAAPLSVDEYFLVRSIDNVLRTGLPAFLCGGYYTRGLLLQYLAAGLRLAGSAPELAPRVIAALSSLATLPAAYILGCRVRGRHIGALAVIVLALSVWEIEMARFGRMYAPFQPVCAWYLVFFVRYCVDHDSRALWPMLILSAIGPLVWEGGALLPLLNLLPWFLLRDAHSRPTTADWLRLGALIALLALAYAFVTADFRGYNAASWPPGYSPALSPEPIDPLAALSAPWTRLPQHPLWAALAVLPLLATLIAAWHVRSFRDRPLAALGLLAVLVATLVQQFAAAGAIVLLLLLLQWVSLTELLGRETSSLRRALIVCALYWLAFGAVTTQWHAAGTVARTLAAFFYQYLRFPDLIGVIVHPWARAVPWLGAALFVLLGIAILRQARTAGPLTAEHALVIALLVLLLAASSSHPPRQETRYLFFLYPLAIVLALATIDRLVRALPVSATAGLTALVAVVALGGFAASEDFQPRHLAHIDQPVELFRRRMNPDLQAHLEIRNDYRGLALWLQQRVKPGDKVINGVHGLDYYYPRIDRFFVDESDSEIMDWSCRSGTVERWGNYPMLYTVQSLKAEVASAPTSYLIYYPNVTPRLLEALAEFSPETAWTEGYVAVVVLHAPRLR